MKKIISTNSYIWTILLFLLVSIITLMLLVIIPKASAPKSLKAIEGTLNLSEVSFTQEDVFSLEGDWEFYPNEELYFGDFNHSPYYVQVPSSWDKYDNDVMTKEGYGTYRLTIILPDEKQLYGLRYTRIRSAGELYIDDQRHLESGVYSTIKDNHQPRIQPKTTYFSVEDNRIEIIIHASNYSFYNGGGLTHPILFGSQQSIINFNTNSTVMEWMLFSAYLLSIIYFLGSFIIIKVVNKKSQFTLLAFTCYILSMSTYKITHGERVFLNIFPSISYKPFFLLQVLPIALAVISLAYYGYLLLPNKWTKGFRNIILITSFISIIRYLSIDMTITSQSFLLENILMISAYIYLCVIFTYRVVKKTPGSLFLVIGVISICIDAYLESIVAYTTHASNIYYPIQPFIFLISQILLNSTLFSHQIDESEKLNMKMLENDRLKNEFLAKTTHEFKSPLNGIINILNSIVNDCSKLSTSQQEDLSLVQGIALRLSTLVNDILDMSYIEHDELKLNLGDVDLNSITELVVHVFNIQRNQDNVILNNNISKELPHVLGDEQRIKQILYNLIGNSIKFTENGSININAQVTENYVEVAITDTGIGISKNNLKNIFNDYYRVTDIENDAGHGLGLSITQKLVSMHGGHIQVDSTLHKGTTTTFTIPINNSLLIPSSSSPSLSSSNNQYAEPPSDMPIIVNDTSTKTIVVVDDEYIGLKSFINALDGEDFKIVAFMSGDDALAYLKCHNRVDLVVLDLMMPGMSGFEVCTEIRKIYSLTELPVLMLTAAINPNDIVAANDVKANDFLNKPYSRTELLARLRSLITVVQSTKHAIEIESSLLLSQIRPHFLYNVLTAIAAIIYTDPSKGRDLLLKFSTYLRMSFDLTKQKNLITFEKELDYIKTLIDIQNVRFDNRIKYHIESNTNHQLFILPLLIEPLVENAIKHGLPTHHEPLYINISILENNELVTVTISDDGKGISQEIMDDLKRGTSTGLGLLNVQKRLHSYYNSDMLIKSDGISGTSIQFSIYRLSSQQEL